MSQGTRMAWDPGTYGRFRGLRLRPALDLIRALPDLPEGGIVDLGCGSGAAGPALQSLGRALAGVDSSAAMLADAEALGVYDALLQADIAEWTPDDPPALIFSNAALHWLPDHGTLLPRLVGMLPPGGVLAVQMPHQMNAPSHRLWRSLVEELFPGRYDAAHAPGVLLPVDYHRLLSPLGRMDLWESEYYQHLAPDGEGHPLRRFTEATVARPILELLQPDEQAQLIAAYESVIDKAYRADHDGSVLFPFRRVFFTLKRAG